MQESIRRFESTHGPAPQGSQELDRDAFLKLLTTQLRYQDPINPMEHHDFIAQMAQFSTLEQIQKLSAEMRAFTEVQAEVSLVAQAMSLLGQHVRVYDEADSVAEGVVSSVRFGMDGLPRVVVNGKEYDLAQILEIGQLDEG